MKTNKVKLAIIKSKAIQLRAYKQIPLYLAKLINDLTGKEETKYVAVLMGMSEHYLRVKGYYARHKEIEKLYESQIKEDLFKMGYIQKDSNI